MDVCLRHSISCREYSDLHGLHCPRLVILNMMDVSVYLTRLYIDALVIVNVHCNPCLILILLIDCCILGHALMPPIPQISSIIYAALYAALGTPRTREANSLGVGRVYKYNCNMSSSSDTSKCVASSSSSMKEAAEMTSNKKVSTSCDQKVESCNVDSVEHNTSSNSSSGIDAVSDSLGRVDISNDNCGVDNDDDELFQDPPPRDECPICLLPMPFTEGICGVTTVYLPCCGKVICDGCSMAEDEEMKKGNIKQ